MSEILYLCIELVTWLCITWVTWLCTTWVTWLCRTQHWAKRRAVGAGLRHCPRTSSLSTLPPRPGIVVVSTLRAPRIPSPTTSSTLPSFPRSLLEALARCTLPLQRRFFRKCVGFSILGQRIRPFMLFPKSSKSSVLRLARCFTCLEYWQIHKRALYVPASKVCYSTCWDLSKGSVF